WGAGLYARLYQGRSYQEMKKYKEALTYYEDLIMQESDEPFLRTLASKAYVQVAQCFNAEKKYDATIEKTEKWLRSARGPEVRSPEILSLKVEVAEAYLRKLDNPEEAANKNKYVREVRELLKDPVRLPGEWQDPAKKKMGELPGETSDGGEPQTFADAYDLAKDALQIMDVKEKLLPQLQKDNPDEAAKAETEIVENREKAMLNFNKALKLVDDETDVDQVNLVRYFLCFLNYKSNKMLEAAILGEFLATKYPDSAGARQGAKIAMASYVAAYSGVDKENERAKDFQDFYAQRVIQVAELIARQWEGQPEADEAYMILVGFNLQVGRFEQAVEALAKIAPESPNRGKAELQIGQAMWTNYLKALKVPEGEAGRLPADELAAMKKGAQETLQAGVTRMKGQGASPTAANASLSLAQIYLDGGDYEKSIGILEDADLGPLVLVNNKFPHAMQPGYAEAAYKAALRAYVSVQPPQQEKAEQVMDALEKHVTSSGDAEAKETLTKIFISLGLELERQIEAMRDEGKTDEILAVSKSFEAFLDRIASRDAGNDWATRNWIASTYFSLGKGADDGGGQSAAIRGYYEKARDAYQKILDEAKSGKIQPPSETSISGVTVRLADCLKQLGDYKAALEIYAKILAEKPTLLDVQFDAANLLVEQGMAEKSDDAFKAAIFGGSPDPETKKPRIWGFGKLSATLARYYSKFGEKFHRARQRMTETRLEWAKVTDDPKRAKDELERAENDINYIFKLFPEMGKDIEGVGDELYDNYDRILKRIQKERGQSAEGLKALGPPPVAATGE
ncbi:MAG: tetratricopeptide repeat protein, partial [Planctomycetales bacterium]|nr:tetratricopeptide repeat protein [Planctomycetales bacterium]